MVRHYLRAQLWVLVCGGVIGPIWLFVYYKAVAPFVLAIIRSQAERLSRNQR
jgi:hypothetical protein